MNIINKNNTKIITGTLHEINLLIKSVPPILLILFVASVFSMNLLANKSICIPLDWFALDCGLIVSWFVFLVLDVLTKHFGPKAATQISLLATLLNFLFCIVFSIVSIIPGNWGESFVEGSQSIINTALDNTFGGTWYIIFISAVSFTVSAVINNFTNYSVGKLFIKNPKGKLAFMCRSYISTAVGQFTDNFIFSLLVSRLFFGWSIVQCITCSLFGMTAELICEGVFTPLGYKICKNWDKNKVGEEYLRCIGATQEQ
ncbi:MAG: VUT family protein [Clostridia bacterium]|nr:VUT family protein [Clostridia bacterium]